MATLPGPPKAIQVVVQDAGSGVNTIIQGDTDGNTTTAEIVVTVNGSHLFGALPSDPHPEFML